MYDEIFSDHFIANLLLSLVVKELWKSFNILRRYGQDDVFLTDRV